MFNLLFVEMPPEVAGDKARRAEDDNALWLDGCGLVMLEHWNQEPSL